jgi:dTDP-4-dehydrorhamnose reductase
MQKQTIIISGKNGQLGSELQAECGRFPQFQYYFFDKVELDITNNNAVSNVFEKYEPSYFINAAAYTVVDKAETEQQAAYLNNAEATGIIAKICNRYNTRLIHISTDYVFDGIHQKPYKEDDATNPLNYYGYSKLAGEQLALENNPETIILRTSWVYSVYGHNFVKTMLRLMKERTDINVVNDQFGSPTYAKDIAKAILEIVEKSHATIFQKGIYHFSNNGIISWYDFACAIKEIKKINCNVHPITTAQYPTPSKRPPYTGLSKEKIQKTFGIILKDWKQSLEACLSNL